MKSSSFWSQLAILGLGFVVFNLGAKRVLRNGPAHLVLRDIRAHPNPTHIFAGNSLMVAGFKPDLWAKQVPGSRPLGVALGAAKPPEIFLLLDQVKVSPDDHPEIYVGFFDRQLTDETPSTWSDLMGNRTVCYLTDIEKATQLVAPHDPVLRFQMRVTALSPLLVERGSLWNRVELLRRRAGEIGMPHQTTNEFGRASDFAALEEKDTVKFARECQTAAGARVPFNPSTQGIIERSKQWGAHLTFIEMPQPSLHRKLYYQSSEWHAYQAHLRSLARAAGAKFVDASQEMEDAYFADALHLGPQGAKIFTRRLAALLAVGKKDEAPKP